MINRFGVGGVAKKLRTSFTQRAHARIKQGGQADVPTGPEATRLCHNVSKAHSTAGSFGQPPLETQQSANRQRAGTSFLRQALAADEQLHERLAALWGMPSELLFERQQAVAKLLSPAGCGAPAQALWLLVRAPQLRHASEAALRYNLRALHRLVSHADIDRAAVLTAAYKHPWIVEAVAEPTAAAPAAAPATPAAGSAAPSQPPAAGSCSATPATWAQELAAVVLELQQADLAEQVASGRPGRVGLRMSPGFAAASVRAYLAVSEVAQWVSNMSSSMASRILFALPGPNPPEAEASLHPGRQPYTNQGTQRQGRSPQPEAWPQQQQWQQPQQQMSSSLSCSSPTASAAAAAAADACGTQQQQQQRAYHPAPAEARATQSVSSVEEVLARLQLQQLLASCPNLTVLPPELLLARYQRLQSVVPLGADAARQLVAANPFLLVTYNDDATARAEAQVLRLSYA